MNRPFISLGDTLRTVADLEPGDAEARNAIFELLGVAEGRVTSAPSSIGAWKPSSTESIMTMQRQETLPKERFQTPTRESTRRPAAVSKTTVNSTLRKTRAGIGTFTPPVWLEDSDELLRSGQQTGPPPATLQLFRSLWRRGILSAILATSVPEGDVDLDRIVTILANRQPLTNLPRRPSQTLRHGVHVLIDIAPGMDPFLEDRRSLLRELDYILADDQLTMASFAGCPDRGVGAGPRDTWQPWKPPPPGTPVLAVTDLGIGGPVLDDDRAPTEEWLRFVLRLRTTGSPLLALVPYEAPRWPVQLRRSMTIIHWSERTTVGEIRRAMRERQYRHR